MEPASSVETTGCERLWEWVALSRGYRFAPEIQRFAMKLRGMGTRRVYDHFRGCGFPLLMTRDFAKAVEPFDQ